MNDDQCQVKKLIINYFFSLELNLELIFYQQNVSLYYNTLSEYVTMFVFCNRTELTFLKITNFADFVILYSAILKAQIE